MQERYRSRRICFLPMYMKEDSERGQALYMDMVFLRRL